MGSIGHIYRSLDAGESWQDTGAPGGGDGYGGFIGDGNVIWAMLANTGFATTTVGWKILPEFDTTSSLSRSNWMSFGNADYADGPSQMIYDPASGIIYSAMWGAGLWKLVVR